MTRELMDYLALLIVLLAALFALVWTVINAPMAVIGGGSALILIWAIFRSMDILWGD
jgi:hypothetical protein